MASIQQAIADWVRCGSVHPRELTAARLELHWAVQPIAAVGNSVVPARPDFSHTTLEWSDAHSGLVGQPLKNGLRFGARPSSMELIRIRGDAVEGVFGLDGNTVAEAEAWIVEALPEGSPALEAPDYGAEGMPDAPAGRGARYAFKGLLAHAELAHWFANAAHLLRAIAATEAGASPVLCWPHHFDIATLIVFDPDEPDAEKARSVGLGMSPGDGSIDEPYFYIGPWPRPDPDARPALQGGGEWLDWGGAALPASKVVTKDSAHEQAEQVAAFLRSGLSGSKSYLGA